jgi:hypothetical protein
MGTEIRTQYRTNWHSGVPKSQANNHTKTMIAWRKGNWSRTTAGNPYIDTLHSSCRSAELVRIAGRSGVGGENALTKGTHHPHSGLCGRTCPTGARPR